LKRRTVIGRQVEQDLECDCWWNTWSVGLRAKSREAGKQGSGEAWRRGGVEAWRHGRLK